MRVTTLVVAISVIASGCSSAASSDEPASDARAADAGAAADIAAAADTAAADTAAAADAAAADTAAADGALGPSCANPSFFEAGMPAVDSAGACPNGGACLLVLASLPVDGFVCDAIAVDANVVYCAAGRAGLLKIATDGSALTKLSPNEVHGFAMDETNIYWTTNASVLMKAPRAGGAPPTPIVTGLIGASNVVAADRSGVYLVTEALAKNDAGNDFRQWSLRRMPLTGADATRLDAADAPFDVASDGANLYWVKRNPLGSSLGFTVMKVASTGDSPTALLSRSNSSPMGLVVRGTTLYWSEFRSKPGSEACLIHNVATSGLGREIAVMSAPVTGGEPTKHFLVEDHLAAGLAVDATNIYVAWVEPANTAITGAFRAAIVSAPIAGGEPVTRVSGQGVSLSQYGELKIAADATSLYWTNWGGLVKLTPK